ncbi:uncharacterized protein LY89DRAFT_49007 [Mollisia scopiformis]|uniref:Uncharacterized protein n=1 Tax=Mollisia scopiformis TaxID=149040 RepID=A0A194XE71_MOLSC|nr:uncharacterized protein LY89DRAFT_49007 [Mollisia scopiformis]KUJ18441.1 hypothetical protein LY89DRAFT_49007 [Mollisia scopiformis]
MSNENGTIKCRMADRVLRAADVSHWAEGNWRVPARVMIQGAVVFCAPLFCYVAGMVRRWRESNSRNFYFYLALRLGAARGPMDKAEMIRESPLFPVLQTLSTAPPKLHGFSRSCPLQHMSEQYLPIRLEKIYVLTHQNRYPESHSTVKIAGNYAAIMLHERRFGRSMPHIPRSSSVCRAFAVSIRRKHVSVMVRCDRGYRLMMPSLFLGALAITSLCAWWGLSTGSRRVMNFPHGDRSISEEVK